MGSFVVVAVHPVLGHAPYFIERIKDVAVKHLGAVGPVEPLDVGILGGLSWLDELKSDRVPLRPVSQRLADEFWAVVHPQPPGLASQFNELIQSPNHPGRRQAGVDLNAQSLPVVVIHHIEGPEASAAPQAVGHEIG